MLSRDSRAERKLKLLMRTQFRFKQGLERIDFEEDILLPEIEKLKAGKSVLGLPDGVAFDIQIATDNESSDSSTHGDGE